MWEQYKKTFLGMQAVIALITVVIYMRLDHRIAAAAVFFAVMQVGGVLGAAWASRLKRKMQPWQSRVS